MGWFWANPVVPAARRPPHPIPRDSGLAPPPECPMHRKGNTAALPAQKAPDAACPYTPGDGSTLPTTNTSAPISKYNPLNHMFSDLSQERAEKQNIALDTERERSSIPKDDGSIWEYPSPQQMYNALLRKGFHDTDPEHVPSMVAVHNFLNEGAWREIRIWEGIFSQGLAEGWKKCERGEAGIGESVADAANPKLVRFKGRPKDMTPKATMVQVMSWLYPSKFKTDPPFDRHDWIVQRQVGDKVAEIRYVIDYYEGPPEPTGEPVFYLDVRPAVDSPTLAMERLTRWGRDVWYRASGASVRERRE